MEERREVVAVGGTWGRIYVRPNEWNVLHESQTLKGLDVGNYGSVITSWRRPHCLFICVKNNP